MFQEHFTVGTATKDMQNLFLFKRENGRIDCDSIFLSKNCTYSTNIWFLNECSCVSSLAISTTNRVASLKEEKRLE